jgi:NAD(P)-dependent dehydrogenase (short-subunit alcohol dehydrogenase family)
MAGLVEGKIVLVTGGGSGIGRAAAFTFSREGAKVVVSDVNVQGGEETVSKIKESGGDAIFVHADVSKSSGAEELVRRTIEAYARVDCAYNNAGILGPSGVKIADYPEDAWDRVIDVNLKGVWLCMKHEIPRMLEQGGGAIVNTASVAGLIGSPGGISAYNASKHGVVGLTKTAALEYSSQGIRVNCVCPGVIRSPMTEPSLLATPESEAVSLARHPIGRLGTPQEVAETVVWLCSDAASFVTGHAMTVDGGLTAQ